MKYSSVGYGFALGLMAVGLLGVTGLPWSWKAYASAFVTCLGLVPTAEAAVDLLRQWNSDRLLERERATAISERQARLEPAGAFEAPLVSPLVAGGLLDEWEAYHLDGLILTLRHAGAAGALTSTALIGVAFRDWEHWAYWTGILAASGLADKANGIATTIRAGKSVTWAKRQVMNGLFEAPVKAAGAPYPALPLPLGQTAHDKVKLEKAGKGGTKPQQAEPDPATPASRMVIER